MVARVQRYDVSRLGKFTRTGAGAVRVPATIARTGVQDYPEDGLREYRPDSEVFAAASLESLGSVPVTLDHPPEAVTPQNVKDYQIGHVSDVPPETRVKVDGSPAEWLKAVLVLSDGDALQLVERADAQEISCGYTCDLDMTPGVDPVTGEKYDAVQRNIRFNHVALLTKDQKARAGAEAKLRLDQKTMKKIVIDGVEYEFGSDAHLTKVQKDHQAKLDAAQAQLTTLQTKVDETQAKLDAAVERAEKAEKDAAAVDTKVDARLALLSKASKLLPENYSAAGKSDEQIVADAVSNKLGAEKIAGKSAAYIQVRFDDLLEDKAEYHKPSKEDAQSPNSPETDEQFNARMRKAYADSFGGTEK